ncbi:hypothetical protein N9Z02_00795 [Akkermansiaceae bacterium]|nr:hypothetical protein [Akkermansiaceae bacterium]
MPSPSYLAHRRLREGCLAFLAAGIFIGLVASHAPPLVSQSLLGGSILWVLVAYWRIAKLNDLEAASEGSQGLAHCETCGYDLDVSYRENLGANLCDECEAFEREF